jgi:hypothetical protein
MAEVERQEDGRHASTAELAIDTITGRKSGFETLQQL